MNKLLTISGSLVGIVLLTFAYYYLIKLEDCLCVQGLDTKGNKSNITYLKYIELFLLVVALLNFFFAFKRKLSPLLSTLFFIIIILLYVVFVMNVVKLYNNMPADCECALQWPRYFIYLQSLLYSITLLLLFIGIFIIVYKKRYIKK